MIRYKDNPNLDLRVVETINGEKEYRINCKKLKHNYYIKNVDCFMVNGLWYRLDSGLIFKDHELNSYVHKNNLKNMIKGIIEVTEEGKFSFGLFTPNPAKNIYIDFPITGETFVCISTDVIKCKYIENISRGTYIINPRERDIANCQIIRNVVNNQNQTYNIEDNLSLFNLAKQYYNNHDKNINKYCKIYAKRLGNITFGMELETIRGYLPQHIMVQNGVMVCRDGSLRDPIDGSQGAEFTTIPLSGEKGLQTILDLCKELSDRTEIDKQCALHLHLGSIDTSRNYLVALWTLCEMIQEDVFKMFPYSKQNEVELAGKNKNYCQKLPKLMSFSFKNGKATTYREYVDLFYHKIFSFLSEGKYPCREFNRKNKNHPRKHKWERHRRYYWVNFMNTIFSDRNTVEFRIHQGTKNAQKIITWLFMCNAIIKFTKQHMYDLIRGKKFTFVDVLNYYCPTNSKMYHKSLSNYLINYYNFMCERFEKMKNKGDYIGLEDIETDKRFSFENQLFSFTKIFNKW